jgi:cell division protein FtsZ
MENRLSVSILSSLGENIAKPSVAEQLNHKEDLIPGSMMKLMAPMGVVAEERPVSQEPVESKEPIAVQPEPPVWLPAGSAPAKSEPKVAPSVPPKKAEAKQEILQFEPVSRGRFEKSEPTIIDGQDLDVPTFLRKNIKVK